MLTKKTRIIIWSMLCLIALMLGAHFAWHAIIEWITDTAEPLMRPAAQSIKETAESVANSTQPAQSFEEKKESAPDITTQATAPHEVTSKTETFLSSPAASSGFAKKDQAVRPKRHRTARRRKKKLLEFEQSTEDTATPHMPETAAESGVNGSLNASDSKPAKPAQHTVTVRNNIATSALAVKHWTGTYSPTKLEVTLNGIPFIIVGNESIALDAAQEVPLVDNKISVHYVYEFMNGMRKGSDTIVYTIIDVRQPLTLSFSWDTAWHVELDGAQRG